MPLSEHEERILAEIERQLAAEDPRFAAKGHRRSLGPLSTWSRTVRMRLAIGLAIVGVIAILGLAASVYLAAAGMVLVLAAIVLGATALREQLDDQPSNTRSRDDVS